jgi:probable phosphoglycerate mutase
MLLYIVRHGDKSYNSDSLTELGKVQAQAVAKRVSHFGIDKIYSSSMIRAQQTAEPTAILTKKDVVVKDWMSEIHTWNEFTIKNKQGEKIWAFEDDKYKALMRSQEVLKMGMEWHKGKLSPFKNGYERILNESDKFFEELGYVHIREKNCYKATNPNDMRVAVFCHSGFGISWLGTLMDIPLPVAWTTLSLSHSSVTVVEFNGRKGKMCNPKILTVSNDSHLYREGLPTKYNNKIFV